MSGQQLTPPPPLPRHEGRMASTWIVGIFLLAVVLAAPQMMALAAITPEQQVAKALASTNARIVEGNLKQIPEGTPGREKVIAHLAKVRAEEKAKAAPPKAGKTVKKGTATSYPPNSLEGLINDPKIGSLFTGAQRVGNLCYLKMNPNTWNEWSRDEQQQAGDLLARSPVWQANGISLVILTVYATEVGELKGGWTGEWKFHRN